MDGWDHPHPKSFCYFNDVYCNACGWFGRWVGPFTTHLRHKVERMKLWEKGSLQLLGSDEYSMGSDGFYATVMRKNGIVQQMYYIVNFDFSSNLDTILCNGKKVMKNMQKASIAKINISWWLLLYTLLKTIPRMSCYILKLKKKTYTEHLYKNNKTEIASAIKSMHTCEL